MAVANAGVADAGIVAYEEFIVVEIQTCCLIGLATATKSAAQCCNERDDQNF